MIVKTLVCIGLCVSVVCFVAWLLAMGIVILITYGSLIFWRWVPDDTQESLCDFLLEIGAPLTLIIIPSGLALGFFMALAGRL